MSTFVSIELFQDRESAEEIFKQVFAEVRRLERLLSRFIEDSEVTRINRLAHREPIVVNPEVFNLIQTCIKWSELTEGFFDITTTGLTELWLKAESEDNLPSDEDIKALVYTIGSRNIVLDNTIFLKNENCRIDLGASAKGYAIDCVVSILERSGIQKALVDFGGNIYLLDKTKSNPEYIGISDPVREGKIIAKVPVKNKTVSTSGSYERFFTINDRRYSHIINPHTGQPYNGNVLSVSVIAESGLIADILSTSILLLGLEKGRRLIEGMGDVEAVVITNEKGGGEEDETNYFYFNSCAGIGGNPAHSGWEDHQCEYRRKD